jgi:hypothetical protein
MIYKISYVIAGQSGSGLIRNEDHLPQPGELVRLGNDEFKITEVIELIPARGDWGYYHVTCVSASDGKAQ